MKDWFNWVKTSSLQAAADLTLNGGRFNLEDAICVVKELNEESVLHIKEYVGEEFYTQYFPSKRHGKNWSSPFPSGLVDHYTAGIKASHTLKWFSNKKRSIRGNSSAHILIDRNGIILSVIDPLTKIAWHAGDDNTSNIGVEHVNAGLLTKNSDGKFYYQETRSYPESRIPRIQQIEDMYWEPYSTAQIISNIVLKRWLFEAIPTLKEDYFTDHQALDPDRKLDCGPLWPLYELNELVFSWKPVRGMDWAKKSFLSVGDIEEFKLEVRDYIAE